MPRYPREAGEPLLPIPPMLASANDVNEADGGTPVLQTALNLANGLEGMGLLALPFTVTLVGELAYPIIVFVACLSGYSAVAIVACLYSRGSDGRAWERQRTSYQDNGTAAFGPAGGRAVLGVQLAVLLAVAGLFLVLIGNALAAAVPGRASGWLGNRGWTVLSWLVISPTAWIPSMRSISWLSGAGVALLGALFGAVAYTAVTTDAPDGSGDGFGAGAEVGLLAARHAELPSFAEARGSTPCVFGMVLFSFSCHTMLPAMEAAMRPSERRLFPAVVGGTFVLCTVLKVLFMLAGWLAFGAATPPVVIAALEPLSLRLAATIAVALNTALTLPMILFVIQMVLTAALPPPLPSQSGGAFRLSWEWFLSSDNVRRSAINLGILGLVVAVPRLTEIMAFAGSFASTTVVFILPLLCHLKIRWEEVQEQRYCKNSFRWLAVGHGTVLLLGIVGGVLGFANALFSCA